MTEIVQTPNQRISGMTGRVRHTFDKKHLDQDVWTLACERMEVLFDRFDHIAVSFSGGKDSTSCLQVAREVGRAKNRLPIHVVFFDEEAIPVQTADYVRRCAQSEDIVLDWYCLPQQHRNACARKSPYWWPWDPDCPELWVRDAPPEGIFHAPWFPMQPPMARLGAPDCSIPMFRYDGCEWKSATVGLVLGIRAQESLNRLRMVTAKPIDNYMTHLHGGVWKVYPIFDWTTEDVWTAPRKFGWDYNHAYDVMDKAGVTPHNQRCSPAFGEEPLEKLWTYAVCFPEIWDKMTKRVPGAATAGRYARTQLYAYGGLPKKPADASWEDFILSFLWRFDDKERRMVKARVLGFITRHAQLTADPIVDNVPHPLTGISWHFLLMIAMRGDFKGRKQPGGKVHAGNVDAVRRNYAQRVAQLRLAGEL